MTTMKPKGKLKKSAAKFGRMKLPSVETSREPPDLTQLRKPIDINLSSLKQVAQLFEKGSEEVQFLLTYECDVVYECRTCRSLFRSLANFISHKRVYCLEKYNVTSGRRSLDPTELIYDRDLASFDGVPVDPEYKENCTNDRILRSQSTRKSPKKDLTSVVDMLTKKHNDSDCDVNLDGRDDNGQLYITNDNEQVLLEIMESNQAAYQTVLRSEILADRNTDLMKSQTLELKSMLNRNTAILGPDGHLLEISDIASRRDDEEEPENNFTSAPNGHLICTICRAKFATKKTLSFHIKSKHMHQMCYPCPCCTSTFTNRWSVYRHLFKVHRKSNDQVRRLRSHIQTRAFRKEPVRLEKVQKENGSSKSSTIVNERVIEETQNLKIAQEWMENLELDAEFQRCAACGKRFERKAALVSHLQICSKKRANERHEGRHKRASKNPPQRVTEVVEAKKSIAIEINDTPTVEITQESESSNEMDVEDVKIPMEETLITPKTSVRSVTQNPPIEISIRVEDVSSLSKDVWDKMGTSDNSPDRGGSSKNRHSSLPRSISLEPRKAKSPEISDVPEVIYTSIDNSRPVALSVLNTEQKLGIQYRGIRLPTVTLEKINAPRFSINPEPCVSINLSDDRPLEPDVFRQPTQFRKLQCLPCNRRFMSMANLRRHVAIHMRRNRYRCKLCDFKALLKCDIVAHCNKTHNAKNNRSFIADLVTEVPMSGDSIDSDKFTIDDSTEETDELEVIDVSTVSSSTQNIVQPTSAETEEISIGKVVSDVSSLPIEKLKESSPMNAPILEPIKARPASSRRKNKRGKGRKRRIGQKTKVIRHVSPPRLPEDSADEMNDIGRIENLMNQTEPDSRFTPGIDEFPDTRAPSRLDRDPELRKMVMEVIFGSDMIDFDGETNEAVKDQEKKNDSESETVLDNWENRELSPPKATRVLTPESMIFETIEKPEIVKMEARSGNSPNNNLYFQQYKDYALKPLTMNHETVVYPKNSGYVAIKVSTPNPAVHQWRNSETSSLSTDGDRLIIHEDKIGNEKLTETEILLALPTNEF